MPSDEELKGHFTITISEEKAYSSEYKPGQIIKQDPVADTKTKSDVTEITVTLCSEEEEEADIKYMPNIVGKQVSGLTRAS